MLHKTGSADMIRSSPLPRSPECMPAKAGGNPGIIDPDFRCAPCGLRATNCLHSLANNGFAAALGIVSHCPHTPKFAPQFAGNGCDVARAKASRRGRGGSGESREE